MLTQLLVSIIISNHFFAVSSSAQTHTPTFAVKLQFAWVSLIAIASIWLECNYRFSFTLPFPVRDERQDAGNCITLLCSLSNRQICVLNYRVGRNATVEIRNTPRTDADDNGKHYCNRLHSNEFGGQELAGSSSSDSEI